MTGTVTCVLVLDDDVCLTQLIDSDGDTEAFTLWSAFTDPPFSAFERITHSIWVSFLRESLANGLPVTISIPTTGANVESVQLGSTLL